MKFLDKLALKIFSIIIIVLAIVISLIIVGVLDIDFISKQLILLSDTGETTIKIILGVLAVLLLLALKGLFFTSKAENNGKDGIILENSNGKLVISKESLDNLISSVIKEIPGAESVSSKTILDRDRNLIIYVTAIVSKDIMIKDVSNDIQARIKDAMKQTADLDVKEVNIRIKNITSKKIKGLPSANQDNNEKSLKNLDDSQNVVDEVIENLEMETSESEEE